MDKVKLTQLLEGYDSQKVVVYTNYVYRLTIEKDKNGMLKNPRSTKIDDNKFAELFKQVNNEGLVFDGVHITLQSTGISYDYVALKNKMLLVYPESEFDIGLVYDGDTFDFEKTETGVKYKHDIASPFEKKDDKIIGAYVIIKNKRGEFLTTLGKEDLEKHRKTAKTDYIWKQWYAEMCMKTIMKKACKLHFGDIFTSIEEQDNENYSLDNPLEMDIKYKSEIDAIQSIEELGKYYEKNKGQGADFDKYVSLRKKQLQG